MKKTFYILTPLACALAISSFVSTTHASIIPTLSLTNGNTENIEVTVYGDPNSTVQLHYGPSASSVESLGSTDASGNFNIILGANSYDLTQCNQTAYVVVDGQQSQTITWASPLSSCSSSTNSSGTPSFNESDVVLNIGQTQEVTITSGTGSYSISSNTNPSAITANISGNIINLYAETFGGSNITVCESSGQCNVIYAVAINNGQAGAATAAPVISSFNVSSNNANGQFMGAGDILTFTFNINQTVTGISVSVGNSPLGLSGSGSGPYTASYTVTGSEPQPIPVVVSFTGTSGAPGQATFALGNITSQTVVASAPTIPTGCTSNVGFSPATGQSCATTTVTTPTVVTTTTTTAPTTTTVGDGYIFSDSMSNGSTGDEITELQKRLTALNLYSGPITGYYGDLTTTAVEQFQAAHNIEQVGFVGPATLAALNSAKS